MILKKSAYYCTFLLISFANKELNVPMKQFYKLFFTGSANANEKQTYTNLSLNEPLLKYASPFLPYWNWNRYRKKNTLNEPLQKN
jgi:hypothetical protein